MTRRLKAIESAEGALLADVAVIFFLIANYLPVGGSFFRVLIFVVFCVLVLRRGLYVGIMALCVALFVVGVLLGLTSTIGLFLLATGGLFLGVTMRRRMHHIPLLLIGVTCGAACVYALFFLLDLLTGILFASFLRSLRISYQLFIHTAGMLAARVGLGLWWSHQAYPLIAALFTLLFTYWWVTLFVALWVALCPYVTVIYLVANSLVRLLGYEVRPFPGKRANRLLRRARHYVVKHVHKWHSSKNLGSHA